MFKEFKEFIMRGNVIDLAVGVVIGGAFGTIVSSLVNDVLMPPIGLLLGGIDFGNLFIDLSGQGFSTLAAAQAAGAPTINYGLFINSVINFLIIALVIFLVIRAFNKLNKPVENPQTPAMPTIKECPYCFTEISIKATRCPNCTSNL